MERNTALCCCQTVLDSLFLTVLSLSVNDFIRCLEVTISVSYEAPSKNRIYYHVLSHNSLFFFPEKFCDQLSCVCKLIYDNMKKSFFACCAHKGELFYPKMGGFCSELSDNKRHVILCI